VFFEKLARLAKKLERRNDGVHQREIRVAIRSPPLPLAGEGWG
jgi:hypothetical protein